MPYIPGAKAHGVVHVADVFHSPSVYVNNVPVALHQKPNESASFVGIDIDINVELSDPNVTEAIAVAASTVNAYLAEQAVNPTGPNKFYNEQAAADGVKGNYAGTIEDGTTSTGTVSVSTSSSDIIPFLEKTLDEANRGLWRETGQGGKPSNTNITGIWTNLGWPSSSPWNTDQTAWCMGFVNFALKCSGYRYVQTASAAQITSNPERWGAVQVPKDQAKPGDIAFWSYRHVNFVYSANNGKFTFVGGNQSPKASNNPNDGDVTQSYPGGTASTNPSWVSCWRVTKP